MNQAIKLREYEGRYRFWEELAIKQTTFINNILLTISVALFGYFNRGHVYTVLVVDFHLPINWSATLFVFANLCMVISILSGLSISLIRLEDFRLTRNILLTKKRAIKLWYLLPDEEPPEESLRKLLVDIFRIILKFSNYKIEKSEIEVEIPDNSHTNCFYLKSHPSQELKNKFNYLRYLTKKFGNLMHGFLIMQLLFFALGLCSYVRVV